MPRSEIMETITFLMTSTFYPPYHIGGDAVHVKLLAEELVKRGHEVHVMHSLDAYRLKRKKLPEKKEDRQVHIHPLKSPFGKLDPVSVYTLGNSHYVTKKFSKIVKDVSPDVVHHHNISLLGYQLFKKVGVYINLYTAHDYWLICQMNNLLKYGKEPCINKSCFLCSLRSKRPYQLWRNFNGFKESISSLDCIITPSEYVKNSLSSELGTVRITHIPNFIPSPPKDIENSEYLNYFLYVGVLEKHKGIMNLLEVFKKYRGEIDARLIIAGKGSLERDIIKFINSNDLEEKIIYLGWCDRNKLYSLYKNALALIMPYICPENCPLTALEALSVGTPIISSNVGGLPEIVEKVNKNLVYNDDEELRTTIVNFKKEHYSSKAKEAYENFYMSQKFINEYFKLFRGD